MVGFLVGVAEAFALAEAEAGALAEALGDGLASEDDLLQEARASDDTHSTAASAAALTGRCLFELTCLRLPEGCLSTIPVTEAPHNSTRSRSCPSSSRVSSRMSPRPKRPSLTGPIAVRDSRRTGWATESIMRRTMRFRPS